MPLADINDVRLHYQRAGRGPAVVFIHGGFANLALQLKRPATDEWEWSWEWDFARHFDFVWYDRRGCYHSSRPAIPDYSLQAQADDLAGLLDYLAIPAAHLIGSSAGGPIAVTFAATRPDRVLSLTLTGTACDVFPPDDKPAQIIKEQIAILAAEGPEAAFAKRPQGIHTSVDVLWEIEEARERGTLRAYLASQHALAQQAEACSWRDRVDWYATELWNIKAYLDVDTCAAAQRVMVPTLVLHGEKDQVVPLDWAQTLADLIPSAQLQIIKGGPHGLLFRSEEARRVVISFLGEL